jgi:thiol-disulfide isomerase/thioredoxin
MKLFRTTPLELPTEGHLPGFEGATGWLNSEPLTPDELRGKVVLVDFWTYTCINWLRTLAWVRAWSEKYADGLVVIGVHTPEFPFEREVDNVRSAVEEMNVRYPVALDPEYEVWRAFSNNYWPAAYIADAEGQIRHHHYGEGGYEEIEQVLQQLLRDAGAEHVGDGLVDVDPTGFEVQADWDNLSSPETYLGSQQGGNFVDGDADLQRNQWSLGGDWSVEPRACVLRGSDGRIAFRFHGRDAHLVMGPSARDTPVPFQVSLDGEAPAADHGFDVDEQGRGTLSQQRLHQLIRQKGRIEDRTLEIAFEAPGAGAYCFTFG